MIGLVITLAIAFAFGYACSRLAVRKGRGQTLWGVLGFFFGLIALIVIAVLPTKQEAY